MPISLISTPFDHFQLRLTLAVNPNLILEPCRTQLLPQNKEKAPTGDTRRTELNRSAGGADDIQDSRPLEVTSRAALT